MSVTAQHGDLRAGERTVITGDEITVREAAQVVAVREQFRVEGFIQDLRECHAVVCLIGELRYQSRGRFGSSDSCSSRFARS